MIQIILTIVVLFNIYRIIKIWIWYDDALKKGLAWSQNLDWVKHNMNTKINIYVCYIVLCVIIIMYLSQTN